MREGQGERRGKWKRDEFLCNARVLEGRRGRGGMRGRKERLTSEGNSKILSSKQRWTTQRSKGPLCLCVSTKF
jgi:hypothetical protein